MSIILLLDEASQGITFPEGRGGGCAFLAVFLVWGEPADTDYGEKGGEASGLSLNKQCVLPAGSFTKRATKSTGI